MFPAEAGVPDAAALRAPGHAAEVAAAGGRGRGGVPDRGGGQRHAGGPQPGGHEGLATHPAEDGREVRTSSSTSSSTSSNTRSTIGCDTVHTLQRMAEKYVPLVPVVVLAVILGVL